MRRLTLVFVLLSLVLPVCAAAGDIEASYDKARKAYFALLESPKKQQYRDQWERVLKLFLAAHAQDPSHQRAADALYMAGKVSHGLYEVSRVKTDARQAVSHFDRLAQDHPGSNLADDGLLQAATLLEEVLDDPREAYQRYQRVVRIYADGDMHGAAREGVRRLARYAPVEKKSPVPTAVIAAAPVPNGVPRLDNVRFHTYPGFTRVVLDLSGDAAHRSQFIPAEPAKFLAPRLVLDLQPLSLSASSLLTEIGDQRVLRVRSAAQDGTSVRVVLELRPDQTFQVFALPDPARLIIDVSSAGVAAASSSPDRKPGGDAIGEMLASRPGEQPLRLNLPAQEKSGGPLRIVVDPGHGGKDPGAIGPRGVMEKDVTLGLARALETQLRKQFNCEVILTRSGDVYLPLDERTQIANRLDADLFISLHANANTSRKPYGIETYFLNFSRNDDVMELAAKENGTSLREVGDLEMILLDLMANAKLNESSRLAGEIQSSMIRDLSRSYADIKDLGVRQGPFYVLFGATMPSVLVETAFISNRREEQRLADKTYQERTAVAIAAGVRSYLNGFQKTAQR